MTTGPAAPLVATLVDPQGIPFAALVTASNHGLPCDGTG